MCREQKAWIWCVCFCGLFFWGGEGTRVRAGIAQPTYARWMGMCVNLSVFRELLFKFTHIVFLGNIGQFRVETLNPPPV